MVRGRKKIILKHALTLSLILSQPVVGQMKGVLSSFVIFFFSNQNCLAGFVSLVIVDTCGRRKQQVNNCNSEDRFAKVNPSFFLY